MIVWAVACLNTSVDRESNNVSLFNVIDQINVSSAAEGQTIPIRFDLVSLWRRDDPHIPETFETTTQLVGPDGESMGTAHTAVIDLASGERHRFTAKITGFPIRGEGQYAFVISTSKEGEVFRLPIDVKYVDD